MPNVNTYSDLILFIISVICLLLSIIAYKMREKMIKSYNKKMKRLQQQKLQKLQKLQNEFDYFVAGSFEDDKNSSETKLYLLDSRKKYISERGSGKGGQYRASVATDTKWYNDKIQEFMNEDSDYLQAKHNFENYHRQKYTEAKERVNELLLNRANLEYEEIDEKPEHMFDTMGR